MQMRMSLTNERAAISSCRLLLSYTRTQMGPLSFGVSLHLDDELRTNSGYRHFKYQIQAPKSVSAIILLSLVCQQTAQASGCAAGETQFDSRRGQVNFLVSTRQKKEINGFHFTSELYRLSGKCLSQKLVPTFAIPPLPHTPSWRDA